MKKEEKEDLNEEVKNNVNSDSENKEEVVIEEKAKKTSKKDSKKDVKDDDKKEKKAKKEKKESKKETKKESKKEASDAVKADSKSEKETKKKASKEKKSKKDKTDKKDKESFANRLYNSLPISEKGKNIILLIVVIILAAFLIYGLVDTFKVFGEGNIFNFGNSNVSQNKENVNVKYDGIDKEGKFYFNPIDIKYERIEKAKEGAGVEYASFPNLNKGIEYVQIDGLKNQEVEDKINNDLKEKIENFTNEYLKNLPEDKKEKTYQEISILGNFNNVLSIVNELEYSESGTLYLNYDLNTGNKIEVNDIFQFDDISKELPAKLRERVVEYEDVMKKEHGDDPHFKSLSEEEITKIVDNMYNGVTKENAKFAVTPTNVFIFTEQGLDSIPYDIFLDKVIIYNRFNQNQDLYDGQYPKVGPFHNLTNEMSTKYKVLEEQDNYYINASVSAFRYAQPNITKEVLDEATKKMNADIEEFKKKAAADKDHFYMYNVTYYMPIVDGPTFYGLQDQNEAIVHTIAETFKTTKEEYDNKYKNEAMEFVRSGYRGEDGAENMIGLARYKEDEGYSLDLFTTIYSKDGKVARVDRSQKSE